VSVEVGGEAFERVAYLDEARVAALLMMQRQAAQEQLAQIERLEKAEALGDWSGGATQEQHITLPAILQRRTLVSTDDGKRVVDDMEVTILSLFDEEDKISVASRLTQFIVLMTRMTKVDHRALSLHILSTSLSEQCQKQFVLEGGYRLLRRWIKLAKDDDCIDELEAIVELLRKLPFHAIAATETEIGKSVKFLKKMKSQRSTVKLVEKIDLMIDEWKRRVEVDPKLVANEGGENLNTTSIVSEETNEIIGDVSQRLFNERGAPKILEPVEKAPAKEASAAATATATAAKTAAAAAKDEGRTAPAKKTGASTSSSSNQQTSQAPAVAIKAKPAAKQAIPLSSAAPTVGTKGPLIKVVNASSSSSSYKPAPIDTTMSMDVEPSAQPSFLGGPSPTASASSAASSSLLIKTRERKQADMAEQARVQLAKSQEIAVTTSKTSSSVLPPEVRNYHSPFKTLSPPSL